MDARIIGSAEELAEALSTTYRFVNDGDIGPNRSIGDMIKNWEIANMCGSVATKESPVDLLGLNDELPIVDMQTIVNKKINEFLFQPIIIQDPTLEQRRELANEQNLDVIEFRYGDKKSFYFVYEIKGRKVYVRRDLPNGISV